MKFLAFLFSLLLGSAVLIVFLRPWEEIERGHAGKPPEAAQTLPLPAPKEPPPQPPPAAQAPQPEQEPTLLATERAEAERQAALDDEAKQAIASKAETKRYFKVRVRDAATLEVDPPGSETLVIRLAGIEARAADEDCPRDDGTAWPCGAKAKAALTLLVRSRAVTCKLPPGGEVREFSSQCSVMNQDLATWLVRRGWATPKDGTEPGLAKALEAAKSERIGLWQGE